MYRNVLLKLLLGTRVIFLREGCVTLWHILGSHCISLTNTKSPYVQINDWLIPIVIGPGDNKHNYYCNPGTFLVDQPWWWKHIWVCGQQFLNSSYLCLFYHELSWANALSGSAAQVWFHYQGRLAHLNSSYPFLSLLGTPVWHFIKPIIQIYTLSNLYQLFLQNMRLI